MTKPIFDKEYECGPNGIADWVAGGNFDGYIYVKSLTFKEFSTDVIFKTTILDQTRYDGEKLNSEHTGICEYTDKDTITVKYNNLIMRGKLLGESNEFIIFTVHNALTQTHVIEVYQAK